MPSLSGNVIAAATNSSIWYENDHSSNTTRDRIIFFACPNHFYHSILNTWIEYHLKNLLHGKFIFIYHLPKKKLFLLFIFIIKKKKLKIMKWLKVFIFGYIIIFCFVCSFFSHSICLKHYIEIIKLYSYMEIVRLWVCVVIIFTFIVAFYRWHRNKI